MLVVPDFLLTRERLLILPLRAVLRMVGAALRYCRSALPVRKVTRPKAWKAILQADADEIAGFILFLAASLMSYDRSTRTISGNVRTQ